MITLAEFLDNLRYSGEAHLSESERTIFASEINFEDTQTILEHCDRLEWHCSIYDEDGRSWAADALFKELQPFRLEIEKPANPSNTVAILTNSGFEQLLVSANIPNEICYIALLTRPIKTMGRLYLPWGDSTAKAEKTQLKSPRSLVKENTDKRIVPSDIGPWLIKDPENFEIADTASKIWAKSACVMTLISLANEIDSETGDLKFKGPPKLVLEHPNDASQLLESLSLNDFITLQQTAKWVYENERESEIKHILLSSEIARSGKQSEPTDSYLKSHLKDSLASAKIAYEMFVSDVGKDTLKALTDLRKAVVDETTKVAESTRQVITAMATTIAVGIGLIAARLISPTIPNFVLPAIMAVLFIHVLTIILSGRSFIKLQQNSRAEWQSRLYSFLPKSEYEKLVSNPAASIERSFYVASGLGGTAVFLMLLLILISPFDRPKESQALPAPSPAVKPSEPKATHKVGNPEPTSTARE